MGSCMSVSSCTMGSMPVMGLCPGPADIQCCIPGSDAGMRPDGGAITPADVLARLGACTRIGGDYAKDVGGTANIPVCETDNVVWWTADLDVDCDTGRCTSDERAGFHRHCVIAARDNLDHTTFGNSDNNDSVHHNQR